MQKINKTKLNINNFAKHLLFKSKIGIVESIEKQSTADFSLCMNFQMEYTYVYCNVYVFLQYAIRKHLAYKKY